MRLAESTTPEAVAEYVNSIVREASVAARRQQWQAEVGTELEMYVGEEASHIARIYESGGERYDDLPTVTDTQRRVTLNRIQNCVISMAAIQAADPPKIEFSPRESGEPPLVYLNTKEPAAMQLAVQMIGGGMAIDPNQPLPDEIATQLKAQVEAAEMMRMQAMASGMPEPPGLLPKEAIVEVTDSTAADWLQTVHDGMWEAGQGQFYFTENTLNKCVLGWQPTYYKFNRDLGHGEFCNVNAMHVFIDPLATEPSRAAYIVWDEVVGYDEALARYPEYGTEIELAASQTVTFPGGHQYTPSQVYEQNFERELVVIRHAWFKHQPYPMTPDEAVGAEIVEVGELPTGQTQPVPVTDELGQPMLDEMGQPAVQQQPIMRQAMLKGGAEVAPGGAGWPQRYGIREVVVIGQKAVIDRQCEFEEFPIAVNVNIPIPYSPYGQGEPKRLRGLQDSLNRVVSAVITGFDYNAYTPEVMHEAVQQAMPEELRHCRTKPDTRITVPAHLFDLVGGDLSKLIQTLDVPAMPPEVWKLIEFLIASIDKEGNQAEVLQGQASGSWSGEAINSLQNAASQVIRFKSARSEFYLKHLARLQVHAITQLMTAEEVARWSNKYPPAIHAAFHARAKSLAVDVSVEISSGSGAARASETNNLVAARGAGVPISDDTIIERMNLDPQVESQKRMKQAREQGAIAMLQPQPGTGEGKETAAGKAEPTA